MQEGFRYSEKGILKEIQRSVKRTKICLSAKQNRFDYRSPGKNQSISRITEQDSEDEHTEDDIGDEGGARMMTSFYVMSTNNSVLITEKNLTENNEISFLSGH